MSFELVRQLQEKAVSVEQIILVLDVSRSGYYEAQRAVWTNLWCARRVFF